MQREIILGAVEAHMRADEFSALGIEFFFDRLQLYHFKFLRHNIFFFEQ